jgi:hypothetical protein
VLGFGFDQHPTPFFRYTEAGGVKGSRSSNARPPGDFDLFEKAETQSFFFGGVNPMCL